MRLDVDKVLSNSLVLTVDSERLRSFYSGMQEEFLGRPMPRPFWGMRLKDGKYGDLGWVSVKRAVQAHLTHLSVLQMARFTGMEFLCVFEDDAYPCIDAAKKMQHYLDAVPDDVDMVKMGHMGYMSEPVDVDDRFQRFYTVGAHAYIVFRRYYDRCIETLQTTMHIDGAAMNLPDANILTTREMLFIQNDFGKTTLHDNTKFHMLMERQNFMDNFRCTRKENGNVKH